MSVTYNFVRSRQLEGTFPGSPGTGAWNTTWLRTMKGWGRVEENLWPHDGRASTWPPPERPELDLLAKLNRIEIYQRVNTVKGICRGISNYGHVQASFGIDDSWNKPLKGIIPTPGKLPIIGSHSIALFECDNRKKQFHFQNSWGKWGDNGKGTLPYSYLPTRFVEGYVIPTIKIIPQITPLSRDSHKEMHTWVTNNYIGGGLVHGIEIFDPLENEMIAWGFAIERKYLEIEELFVRPNWRMQGYGSLLSTNFVQMGSYLGKKLMAWIPHSDCGPRNEVALNKILHHLGLSRNPSPVRWASAVGK